MKKRILALFLSIVMVFSVTFSVSAAHPEYDQGVEDFDDDPQGGGGNTEGEIVKPEETMDPLDITNGLSFSDISDDYVKFVGRVIREDTYLRAGFCGTGLEFNIQANEATDFILTYSAGGEAYRLSGRNGRSYDVRIYVDAVYDHGVLQNPESDHLFECLEAADQTISVPISAGKHHIEVFLESQMPRINREDDKGTETWFHFDKVKMNGSLLERPKDKEHFIEFVGASGSGGCAMEIPYYPGCIASWENANASKCHVNFLSKILDCDVANVTEGGLGLYGYDSQEGVENAIQLQDLYPYVDYKAYWNNEATFDSYQGGRQPDICFVIIGSNDRATDKDDYDMWKERAKGLILDIKARRGEDIDIIWGASIKKPLQYRAIQDLIENDPDVSKYDDIYICQETRAGGSATSTIGGQLSGHPDELDQLAWAYQEEEYLKTHGFFTEEEPAVEYLDYYVSETGDDTTGTGTEENPYLTIPKLMSAIKGLTFSSGQEVRINVTGTVKLTGTQSFAQITARIKRADGTPLPITVATKDFNGQNRAVLTDTSSPSGTGSAHLYTLQPVTYKDVQLSSVSTGDIAVNNLWAYGSKVVLDNTTFATNNGEKWNLFASAQTYNAILLDAINGKEELLSELVLKNGAYDSSMLNIIATSGYGSIWKNGGSYYSAPGITCKVTVGENAVVDGSILKFNNTTSLPVTFRELVIEVGTKGKVTGDFIGTPEGTSEERLSTKNNYTFILNGGNVKVRHFQMLGNYFDVTGNIHFRGIGGELETDGTDTGNTYSSIYFAGGANNNTVTGNKHVEISGGFYHVVNPVSTTAVSSFFAFGGGGTQTVTGNVHNEIRNGGFLMDVATLFDKSGNIPKVGAAGGFYFAHTSGIIEGTLKNEIVNGWFNTSLTTGKCFYLGGKNVLDCINHMENIIGIDVPGMNHGPTFDGCDVYFGSNYGQYGVTEQVKGESVPDGIYSTTAVETTIYGGYFYKNVYLSPCGKDYPSTGVNSFVKGSVDLHIQCGSFQSTSYLFGGRILGQANAQIDYGFFKNFYGAMNGAEIRDGLSVNFDNMWSYSGAYEGFKNVSPKYYEFYPVQNATVSSVTPGRNAVSLTIQNGVFDDLHLNASSENAVINGNVFYEISGGKFKSITTNPDLPASAGKCVSGGYYRNAPAPELLLDGYAVSHEYNVPLYRYTVTDGEIVPALHEHCYCGGNCASIQGAAKGVHTCDPAMSDMWMELGDTIPISGNTTSYYFLTHDVTLSDSRTLAVNQKLYICLNGYTLSYAGKLFLLGSHGDCELYICDCKGTGRVVNTKNDFTSHGGIAQLYKNPSETYSSADSVKMEIYGGNFEGSISASGTTKRSGGQFNVGTGVLNIYGGTFEPNANALPGTVYPDGGCIHNSSVTNIYGGTIKGFKADNGGSIYNTANGSLNLYGGEIVDGKSVNQGGNIYNSGDLSLSGDAVVAGGFAGCDGANKTGGNIFAYVDGKNVPTLSLNGGILTGGQAVWGGNFYTAYMDVTFNGTKFGTEVTLSDGTKRSGGTAQKGGNIYIEKKKLILNNVTITDGTATGAGGGNIFATSEIEINGSEIRNGIASGAKGCGGNILIQKNNTVGKATLTDTVIKDGKTGPSGATYGGNIYIEGAEVTLNGCTVQDGENRGGGNGGNIASRAGTNDTPVLTIHGGQFLRGKGKYSGANIYIFAGIMNVSDDEGDPAIFVEGTTTGTTTARNISIGKDAVSASFNHAYIEAAGSNIGIYSDTTKVGNITANECYFKGNKPFTAENGMKNGVTSSYFTIRNPETGYLYDDLDSTALPFVKNLGSDGGVTVNGTYFQYKNGEGYRVMIHEKTVTGTISVFGLQGAGWVDKNEPAVLKMPVHDNGYSLQYLMVGADGSDEKEKTKVELSDPMIKVEENVCTYIHSPISMDTAVDAYYVFEEETVRISIEASAFDFNGASYEKNFEGDLSIGDYTVQYTGTEDFKYWVNSSGNVISKSMSYDFHAGTNTTLKAVVADTERTFVFLSDSGQVIKTIVPDGDQAPFNVPSVPLRIGKTGKWISAATGAEVTDSDSIWALGLSIYAEFRAVYEEDKDAAKATVHFYRMDTDQESVEEIVLAPEFGTLIQNVETALGNIVSLEAPAPLEKKLLGIFREDGKLLSNTAALTLRAINPGEVYYYAVYTTAEVTPLTEPSIRMLDIAVNAQDSSKYTFTYTVSHFASEDYEVTERGILFTNQVRMDSYRPGIPAEEALKYNLINEVCSKYSAAHPYNDGTITLNLANIPRETYGDVEFHAVGYLVYLLNGKQYITYSDVQSMSINEYLNQE